jgi:arylsulfatase
MASHWGGTRNGTIVHWPARIKDAGAIRTQFSHLIDVAPTILEAAGLPEPTMVNGVLQKPIEGSSMLSTFDSGDAPEFHETQYFEVLCNRGIYHKGWIASTVHKAPWEAAPRVESFADDRWELYGPEDWTQFQDLAAESPEMLERLQQLWMIEATKHSVLPLDDRSIERLVAEMAGRPQLITGNKMILYKGMTRVTENTVLSMKNKSSTITAEVEVPEGGAEGVIIAQGGTTGGWSFYAHQGKLKYCYNVLGITKTFIESENAIPAGTHQVRMEFDYDGGGLGKGGQVTLYVDGEVCGGGRLELTIPMLFSADETVDVGKELGSPVSPDYGARDNAFTGSVNWVELETGSDDHDHLITPEERLKFVMARD